MGREIVYCEGCGKRLSEDDFDRGKAQDYDNRPFCSTCRPIVEAPPAAPTSPAERKATERRTTSSSGRRRGSTERIPHAQPPPGIRRQQSDGSSSGSIGLVVGGIGAALVILIVAVMSFSSRGAAPSTEVGRSSQDGGAAVDGAEDRLRDLESFAEAVSDPQAVLTRCDQLRGSFRGTAQESRFRQVESRAQERLKEKERSAELDRRLASIRRIMQDDLACIRRSEVEGLLEAVLKTAGPRSAEIQKLQTEYRSRCEETLKRLEAERKEVERKEAERKEAERKEAERKEAERKEAEKKKWEDLFNLATNRVAANDYPGAKTIYLEALATLPETRPEDLRQRAVYCIGLYNLACIYAVESGKLADKAKAQAADQAFKYLDWSLRSDYGKFRCPCHPQTLGLGHMGDDKDMDPIRKDARFAELLKKYK